MWRVGITIEIKMVFQISPALLEAALKQARGALAHWVARGTMEIQTEVFLFLDNTLSSHSVSPPKCGND